MDDFVANGLTTSQRMDPVAAIQHERDELVRIGRELGAEEWALPSDCEGWSVKDVYAHLWLGCEQILNPDMLVPAYPDDIEATLDAWVREERDRPAASILACYTKSSELALRRIRKFREGPIAGAKVRMQNLGIYTVGDIADANAFDHYAHLRLDLLAPGGPLAIDSKPADDLVLPPTIAWMIRGLPQMCATELARITEPVTLVLDGPGGGRWTFAAGSPVEDPGDVACEVRSGTADFVVWGTRRRPWSERAVSIDGDRETGQRFCDAVNVV